MQATLDDLSTIMAAKMLQRTLEDALSVCISTANTMTYSLYNNIVYVRCKTVRLGMLPHLLPPLTMENKGL